jgi:plastocyanin
MIRHTIRIRPLTAGIVSAGLAVLLLHACGGGYSSSPTTPYPSPSPTPVPAPTPTPEPGASAVVIEIVGINGNMSFSPGTASLRVGQQVRWHNADGMVHTATQNGGGFDTGLISPGASSAPITVDATGTLSYHCEVHPSMVGSLAVTQ